MPECGLATCKSGCAKNHISRNGSTLSLLSSPPPKNISLCPSGKSSLEPRAIPHPQEGRIAIVTDVGRGMRWTLWRRVDERRHGGRRSRVVLTPRRWRQALRIIRKAMVAKKPGSPGRARSKPLKPLRREGRVCPRPVVTNSRVFLLHARLRVRTAHAAFPAPSILGECSF
jgi:hypothetical protein